MAKKKPYKERSDLEKVRSQWRKLKGLHSREEWSAVIVRAATAAELAANYVVRREFRSRSSFDRDFMDSLLKWANGLAGKMDRLLIPMFVGEKEHQTLKRLGRVAQEINKGRNAIVHGGEFSNEDEARAAIETTRVFIEELVRLYKPLFKIRKVQ